MYFVECFFDMRLLVVNLMFSSFCRYNPLEDLLRKKTRSNRTKKTHKEEKKKLPTIVEPPVSAHETVPCEPEDPEPEIPLVRKKSQAPKEKGVTIKEPFPPTVPKVAMVEGKGKEKLEGPPAKKQKLAPASE